MRKSLVVVAVVLMLIAAIPVRASTNHVQMPCSGRDKLGAAQVWHRLGQRMVIPDRTITEIGYAVWKVGNATGPVTMSIRDGYSDAVVASKVWGDASALPALNVSGYQTVVLDSPVRVAGQVILCIEYYGGDLDSYCMGGYYSGDKITGEWYVNYLHDGRWHDIGEAEEGSYYYAYVGEDGTAGGGSRTWAVVVAGIGVGVIGLVVIVGRVRRKRE